MSALAIEALSVARTGVRHDIIDEITLSVGSGEVVGLVGESGAGKTTLGLAALGFMRDGTEARAGDVKLHGESLLATDASRLTELRGRRISFVPQHPAAALNPASRVRKLLSAMLTARRNGWDETSVDDRIGEVLRSVSLPDTSEFRRRYPHQLSGGQRRRLAIAIALACDPDAVVLDEPTSGLDAATRSRVLATIRRLSDDNGVAVLCISHDLASLAEIADRVVVLYAGHVVEEGPTRAVLTNPAHPYTRHLLAAIPRPGRHGIELPGLPPGPADRGTGCRFVDRCDLAREACGFATRLTLVAPDRRSRCIDPFTVPVRLRARAESSTRRSDHPQLALSLHAVSAYHHGVAAMRSVSLDVMRGEVLGLVGESGAGKTTLIRTIVGSHSEWCGRIELDGVPLANSTRRRTPSQRRGIQLVPQHPYESFNPRRVIGDSVARPLLIGGTGRRQARRAIADVLTLVSLGVDVADRYPAELSGGELQRAAIARAVVGEPQILLCDEITASLDGVVQAAIVELLGRLRTELGLTIVFVSHDLGLVRAISDRIAVIADGRLVETGSASAIAESAAHPGNRAPLANQPAPPA